MILKLSENLNNDFLTGGKKKKNLTSDVGSTSF